MQSVYIMLASPGSQGAWTYSPVDLMGSSPEAEITSKPVPPPGILTKRRVIGVIRWEPGRKDNAPFVSVHGSRAIQKPRALGGLVYWVDE
jgi:hypothetical protein